jgi:hypothetical protein
MGIRYIISIERSQNDYYNNWNECKYAEIVIIYHLYTVTGIQLIIEINTFNFKLREDGVNQLKWLINCVPRSKDN